MGRDVGPVSDQDGADRQGTVEAARAEAEASSCDRAQRRRRREGSSSSPADTFPEQFEAYIVRNDLPVVYSSVSHSREFRDVHRVRQVG